MNNTIESLRRRPDHHKKAVAFMVSFAITAVIFSFWLSSRPFFNSDTTVIAAAAEEKGPLAIFADNLASGYKGFKELFK